MTYTTAKLGRGCQERDSCVGWGNTLLSDEDVFGTCQDVFIVRANDAMTRNANDHDGTFEAERCA